MLEASKAARKSLSTISEAVGALGCVSAIDSAGQTIWIADAHRDNGKRFVVHADEKLTAFLELERVIRDAGEVLGKSSLSS